MELNLKSAQAVFHKKLPPGCSNDTHEFQIVNQESVVITSLQTSLINFQAQLNEQLHPLLDNYNRDPATCMSAKFLLKLPMKWKNMFSLLFLNLSFRHSQGVKPRPTSYTGQSATQSTSLLGGMVAIAQWIHLGYFETYNLK